MARVTVEDCILKIPNRYELTLINAERAKNLIEGAEAVVSSRPDGRKWNDKPTVVALREIAKTDGALLDFEELTDKMIGKVQVINEVIETKETEDVEDEELASLDSENIANSSEFSENDGFTQVENPSDTISIDE